MRKVACDRNAARKRFGDALADVFLSLLADMRNATYLGELLEAPKVIEGDPLLLQYFFAPECALEVQPLGSGVVGQHNWRDVHRIKLVRVLKQGTKLV